MITDTKNNVYVVFPVHNRLESTQRFLKSLKQQTFENFQVVICDDGSTDGTGEYLSSHHPEVVVLEGDGNLWWSAGINKCIEYVLSHCHESDFVLTINNDALLPDWYLKQKMARAEEYRDSIIGSLGVYADNEELIETSGYILDFDSAKLQHLTKPGDVRSGIHKGMQEVTHLPGKGVLLPVKVFRDVGLYDAANLPQYHADTDLVLRAHKSGYKVFVDFDSIVYSEVNTNNMVLPSDRITIKGMLNTFVGPYSMHNFRVRNYYAKKHIPNNRRFRYLFTSYVKIIGGQLKRYLRYKYSRLKLGQKS